jgi:hypothetical protein
MIKAQEHDRHVYSLAEPDARKPFSLTQVTISFAPQLIPILGG